MRQFILKFGLILALSLSWLSSYAGYLTLVNNTNDDFTYRIFNTSGVICKMADIDSHGTSTAGNGFIDACLGQVVVSVATGYWGAPISCNAWVDANKGMTVTFNPDSNGNLISCTGTWQ